MRIVALALLLPGMVIFLVGWITIEVNTPTAPNLWLALAIIGVGMAGAGGLLGLILGLAMANQMFRKQTD